MDPQSPSYCTFSKVTSTCNCSSNFPKKFYDLLYLSFIPLQRSGNPWYLQITFWSHLCTFTCTNHSFRFSCRTLLIREALIFLNRLVSNAQYSGPVLRVLTNSRDVAFLTIDIANRLSRKGKWLWQSDTMTRQIRESEIVDLARVFKKRVFNFLGDSIS